MQLLSPGTTLSAGEIQVPGAPRSAQITIAKSVGECPHGHRYEARQDKIPLLLTLLDPDFVARAETRSMLIRDIERARTVRHKNLLPGYGASQYGHTLFVVQGAPGGHTVRDFMHKRQRKGRRIDHKTAYTLCAHICNGLAALHRMLIHGFITADTVYVTSEGRVLISAAGEGGTLVRAPGFERFRVAGLLPNLAPEQTRNPPEMVEATDVFGVATLFIEMLTGKALSEPGQSLYDIGVHGPAPLVACLERATAANPDARHPDIAAFKAELGEALGMRTGGSKPIQVESAPHPMPYGGSGAHPMPTPGSAPHPMPYGSGAQPVPGPPGSAPHPMPQPPPGYPGMTPPPGYPPYGPQGGYPPGAPPPPPGYADQRQRPPTMYGMPAQPQHPPAPPPQPQQQQHGYPPPGGGYDVSALEQAAARIDEAADEDDVHAVTDSVDDHLRQPPPPPPRAPGVPEPVARPGSSESSLGLELQQYDNVLDRLSSVDGTQASHSGVTSLVDGSETQAKTATRPDEADAYFGSFAAGEENLATPRSDDGRAAMAAVTVGDEDDRRFILTRDGVDQGPFDIDTLVRMVKRGEIASVDRVRERRDQESVLVADIPELRQVIEQKMIKAQRAQTGLTPLIQPSNRPARKASPVSSTGGGGRGLSTIVLVLVVIGAFLGAAAWLYTKSQGQ